MPTIKPSTELQNNYDKISEFCKESREAVFITKDGRGDLAVMSIAEYNRLVGMNELYAIIDKGLEDVKQGRVVPFEESINKIIADLQKKPVYTEKQARYDV